MLTTKVTKPMKISSNLSHQPVVNEHPKKKGYSLFGAGVAGLALLGNAQGRQLQQASPAGSPQLPAPSASGLSPAPTAATLVPFASPAPASVPSPAPSSASMLATNAPGFLVPPAPAGVLPPVQKPSTQGSAVPAWLSATNSTSALPLAWAGNINGTTIPGLGPVVLPSPLSSVAGNIPASLMSPWYDYMTQPAIPSNVSYTTTMQGPGYYWGVLFDRGANFEVGSNDVVQGFIGNCAIGASIISIAEAGMFHGNLPLGIANKAPKPYFDVKLYSAPGQLAVQQIDDMLPWSAFNKLEGFLGYQPAIDSVNTPASSNNANTVLSVPYIEKAMAKLLDKYPNLKPDPTLTGYAALSGISVQTTLMALTGKTPLVMVRPPNADTNGGITWHSEVLWCLQNVAPCVFGTADTLDRLAAMGDSWNPTTLTAGWKDGATMQWTTKGKDDLLLYTPPGQAPWVFVAAHAYGMMRNGYASGTQATLANPWHANLDVNGNGVADRLITVPELVLERVMVEIGR